MRKMFAQALQFGGYNKESGAELWRLQEVCAQSSTLKDVESLL